MDPEFIEKNQIVERYLAGKLPFKGQQDFERYCRENPEVLDEIQLPDRLHAGMKLLEASGRAPAGRKRSQSGGSGARAFSRCSRSVRALLSRCGYSGPTTPSVVSRLRHSRQSSRPGHCAHRLRPAPSGSSRIAMVHPVPQSLNLQLKEFPELIELHVDLSYTRLNLFRFTIDKKNQARAGSIYNVLRDSNGEVRFAFNTSALTPGDYAVAIEGVPQRGSRVAAGWFTVRVVE